MNPEDSLSVVLPAYNEEGNIEEVIQKTDSLLFGKEAFKTYEIIVVNDGSSDKTADILRKLAQRITHLKIVTHNENLGYGKAITSGLKLSQYSLILLMDADGQFEINQVDNLLKYIPNYDIIMGYRYKRNDPFYRIIFGRAYTFLINILLGTKFKDINCGFKLLKKETLRYGLNYMFNGGVFYAGFLLNARKAGLKIAEVSVKHYPRLKGKGSGAGLKTVSHAIIDIIKLFFCTQKAKGMSIGILFNKLIKKRNRLDLALVLCPAWGVVQPPVGISYLKGFLSKLGFNIKCFDFSLALYKVFPDKKYWDLNYPDHFIDFAFFENDILPTLEPFINIWAEEILKHKPRVVGFSLFMSSINASLLLAKHLKKLKPDVIIVGGGPEVTRIKRVCVDGIARRCYLNKSISNDNAFDLLIEGEGEQALVEILSPREKGLDIHRIEGGVFVSKGQLVANRARGLMHDLDVLSPPDYSDFELNSYTKSSLPIVTSRGCINRCTFCADSPLWKKYRQRSPENVVQEMKVLIAKYQKYEFEIVDSTFNGDIGRMERICDLIIESKTNIRWSAKASARKELSFALLNKMKSAGCSSLSYGVESGSPSVLLDMRKNINLEEVKMIIKDTWRAGIEANCFFLIGYPTETEEDFQLTLDFIKESACYICRFDQVTGCHIEEDSYLSLNFSKYGIVFEDHGWCSKDSTPEIRKDRLERFRALARELHKHYKCEVQA